MGDSPGQRSLPSLRGSRESRSRTSILGENFSPFVSRIPQPRDTMVSRKFLLRNALTPGDTRFRGGRHHGVVPTLTVAHGPWARGMRCGEHMMENIMENT